MGLSFPTTNKPCPSSGGEGGRSFTCHCPVSTSDHFRPVTLFTLAIFLVASGGGVLRQPDPARGHARRLASNSFRPSTRWRRHRPRGQRPPHRAGADGAQTTSNCDAPAPAKLAGGPPNPAQASTPGIIAYQSMAPSRPIRRRWQGGPVKTGATRMPSPLHCATARRHRPAAARVMVAPPVRHDGRCATLRAR
jgi:hypothetical protein